MSRILNNIEVSIDKSLEEHLAWLLPEHGPYRILRQSVDARRRHAPHFVYSLEVAEKGESLDTPNYPVEKVNGKLPRRPVIVGTGPAGLFAALRFVERGVPCLLLERGGPAEERIKGINRYWRYGELSPRNNVCFGEGGAGLYSDGKLITRIKSPHIPYVLQRLVKFGAPEEIQFLANPHVGSDKIRRVIPKLREYLLQNGCEIKFHQQVTEVQTTALAGGIRHMKVRAVKTETGEIYETDHLILATGHSAEDMLRHLHEIGVFMEGKSFALGLRIEHPQELINKIQFREHFQNPRLGSANYRLTYNDQDSKTGVYSFCMCPGGYVLSAGTEADGLVCNGMSNFNRNSKHANAAIVVSVDQATHYPNDLFGGLKLRRELETQAFQLVRHAGGSKELPGQLLGDFLAGRASPDFKGSSPSGAKSVRLDQLTPPWLYKHLNAGLESFEQNMKGFLNESAHLYGMETRTSCPVRITRHDEDLQSISHLGLYPCGEGAGYAGGITSAACDGIRVADRVIADI